MIHRIEVKPGDVWRDRKGGTRTVLEVYTVGDRGKVFYVGYERSDCSLHFIVEAKTFRRWAKEFGVRV